MIADYPVTAAALELRQTRQIRSDDLEADPAGARGHAAQRRAHAADRAARRRRHGAGASSSCTTRARASSRPTSSGSRSPSAGTSPRRSSGSRRPSAPPTYTPSQPCPSCPRSRPSAASSPRTSTGRTIVRARIDDTRLVRPEPPEAVAARLTGARVTGLGRRGKHLLIGLDGRRHAGRAPAHDRQVPASATCPATSRTCGRCSTLDDGDHGRSTPTSAASARGACSRASRSCRSSSTSASASSRSTRLRRPRAGEAVRRPARGREGDAARPAARRRRRQHLRRRGAVGREGAPGDARRPGLAARQLGPARGGDPRGARGGARRAGLDACATSSRPTAATARCRSGSRCSTATGEPCERCGTPIVKLRVAGRGTHVCPRCQRRRLG